LTIDIDIVNGDAIDGPGRQALAEMVKHVAENFEREYAYPDDPYLHGRSFMVIEADAELILRLTRDQTGRESITIVDVIYSHAGSPEDDG
jgi:hypothetical protein